MPRELDAEMSTDRRDDVPLQQATEERDEGFRRCARSGRASHGRQAILAQRLFFGRRATKVTSSRSPR